MYITRDQQECELPRQCHANEPVILFRMIGRRWKINANLVLQKKHRKQDKNPVNPRPKKNTPCKFHNVPRERKCECFMAHNVQENRGPEAAGRRYSPSKGSAAYRVPGCQRGWAACSYSHQHAIRGKSDAGRQGDHANSLNDHGVLWLACVQHGHSRVCRIDRNQNGPADREGRNQRLGRLFRVSE